MKNLKIEKEVEERCNKYFSKYEKRLDEKESKLDKKVDLDEVKALIEENKESAATGGNNQDGTLTSQLEEFKESMARKSNIIIFRAEESKKTEPKERKVEDIAPVNELCKITGTNKQTVKNVTRLGKKNVDSEIPSPMRVIFEDEKAKGSLMANMKNLATTEDKFKQISITHDMTKKERLQNREKLAEAKNKKDVLEENNQSVKYKYLVKGHPRDRRVVKVKKKE
jgi:mRNA-degrading endonuclease YafQ of YafQ-DinJ toxin-antitoxin module